MNRVEVGRARKVGVAGTGVADDPQAVNMADMRMHPMRIARRVFVFIINSSFDCYQYFTKTESFPENRVWAYATPCFRACLDYFAVY
jgi:hypothetical protein